MLSLLLSVGYLLPIVARGFFLPAPGTHADGPAQVEEAPVACLIALSVTAALTVVLFFFAGAVETLLAGLSAGAKP
jgi:multicomponent Na+:H+ antiporter subunit D